MQKRLLTLLVLVLAFQINTQAQINVEQTQRSLFTKMTATWCPNCGTWGWNFMETMIDDIDDQAVVMGVHFSGDLATSVGEDLRANFGANGQPQFYLNNINQGVSSSNNAAKVSEVMNNINNTNALSPMANVGLAAVYTSDEIVAFTNTKFFQAASGRYMLALYVVENDVIANQASQGANTMHPKVLRASFGDSFGEEIANGNVDAGVEIGGEYRIAINPNWNLDNISIVGIIWQDINNTQIIVNTFEAAEINPSTSNKEVLAGQVNMQVTPTIIQDVANINLTLETQLKDAKISILDMTGKELTTIFSGDLAAGTQTIALDRSTIQNSGMYLVQLTTTAGILTKKVVLQ